MLAAHMTDFRTGTGDDKIGIVDAANANLSTEVRDILVPVPQEVVGADHGSIQGK